MDFGFAKYLILLNRRLGKTCECECCGRVGNNARGVRKRVIADVTERCRVGYTFTGDEALQFDLRAWGA
jgi:hypothetical protein